MRLRNILNRDDVSGARGYCQDVFDSCGVIRSVDVARERWTVALFYYSHMQTRMRSAGIISILCLSHKEHLNTFMQRAQCTARDRAKSHNEKQKQREVNEKSWFRPCFVFLWRQKKEAKKRSRLEGLNVGKKQGGDKRPIVRDRSVPGKEGREKKATTGWSPGPIVSEG